MATGGGGRRALRTVLFTDIVGSTELAASLGDRGWRALIARHHAIVRRSLKRHRGREVDTAGDGFFATFADPADAVACAIDLVATLAAIGVRIRAGIHTGDVEVAGRSVSGIAVHVGARLMALAGPGEVVVSNTVQDLVAGAGWGFTSLGTRELKGVSGARDVWRLELPPEVVIPDPLPDPAQVIDADRHATRRRLLAAVLAMVILAVGVGGAAVALRPSGAPAEVRPDAVVAFDRQGTAVASVAIGGAPAGVAVGGGAVWVASLEQGTVVRIDVRGGQPSVRGNVGARPTGVVAAGDSVWISDPYNDQLAVVEATRQEVLATHDDLHAVAAAVGGGSIWFADDLADTIHRFDDQTRTALAPIQLPAGAEPTGIAIDGDRVWIAGAGVDAVLPVEMATGSVGQGIPVPAPSAVAVAAGSLWAISASLDRAYRIDLEQRRLVQTIDVCDTPTTIATDDAGLWLGCVGTPTLARLDGAGAVALRVELPGPPTGLAVDGERVWVGVRQD